MVAVGGLLKPAIFTGISTSYFTGLLGLLMLSMGITLTVAARPASRGVERGGARAACSRARPARQIDDFKRVLQRPGVSAQHHRTVPPLVPRRLTRAASPQWCSASSDAT